MKTYKGYILILRHTSIYAPLPVKAFHPITGKIKRFGNMGDAMYAIDIKHF